MANRKQRIEPATPRIPHQTLRVELRACVRIDLYANAAFRWLCRGRRPDLPRIVAVVR